ncbi:TPA: hypothetical protein ACY4QF_004319 [Vibrio parahaemolyticus]|uniref:hypothetical protein n=1 Tax=Vibrio parahaemolyticus TaxID=670 RepID=UPI002362878A|nr:hypothetical protein [Vibrio parahaemolyticus]HCG7136372.1 hypothetical protein [Vibrio parahaemolyticus]
MSEKVYLGTLLVAGFYFAMRWAFKSDTSSFDESLERLLSKEVKAKKDNSTHSSATERRRKVMSSCVDARGGYQKMQKAKAKLHPKQRN